MNRLSSERRAQIIRALVEGNSVRSTCRITGAAKGTVLRLLEQIGDVCAEHHDRAVRGIEAASVQCDEVWSYVGAKQKNVKPERRGEGIGDAWTYVGIDAHSKLVISWYVGRKDAQSAHALMGDLASRLATRTQITTDGRQTYPDAVEAAFGRDVDYAQLVKLYGPSFDKGPESRYSPATCVGTAKEWRMGRPLRELVSTSHVERQNLTVRMHNRRFTRLTNAFSKKLENHRHSIALHFFYYNWCRPHQTLTKATRGIHRTPAMEAGLTDRVWTLADLVAMLERREGVTS